MKKRIPRLTRRTKVGLVTSTSFTLWSAISLLAAPAGPPVQVPEGGSAPGPYPNTGVSGVNVIARGSTTFDGGVEITGFDGQGPIPWSVNRYNRGDIALRLSPADPTAAMGSLNQGFIEFADESPELPASHAWRPSPVRGAAIPTARQNGPIDWGDGEGPFFPTIAMAEASSAPGYDMVTGAYGNGNLDVNTGRAGTHDSSPEVNFAFSLTWFPYDQGWLGGDVAGPLIGDPFLPDGTSRWTSTDAHAPGLAAGLVRWLQHPPESGIYGGHADLRLPGVNALEDGMLFATSIDGGSDVNIVGVAPLEDGSAWLVTIREDSATDAETLADPDQSEFRFVYIPFDAPRLIGGHIVGADGSKRKAAGDFTVTRTATGTYEVTIPGKTGSSGTLLLQAAALESDTSAPLATRAFLSYEFSDGKFIVQSRVTSSDTTADLADVDFYLAWIDFAEPLEAPAGPRMRSLGPVAVSPTEVEVAQAGIAAHATEPELLVTTVDTLNAGGYTDPITGEGAIAALIGRFVDANTLTPTSEPFVIFGNATGGFNRHDVKYSVVSNQYVVVANATTYGANGRSVPLIALVKPASEAGSDSPVIRAFAYNEDTEIDFEDIAVAVSTRTGNFMIVAEYKVPDEGEAVVGAMFSAAGEILTPEVTRLDVLQSIGDEDDPDVIYLEEQDAFLYFGNTDNSNGSDGPYSNRVAGALVDPQPDSQGRLVTRPEQAIGDAQPEGVAEGHPAALENPFNGELIVAFDAGNDTPNGSLAFVNIGPAPDYVFTPARPEIPYFAGEGSDPFGHRHPQLAADPDHGVIIVGFNSNGGGTLGYPPGYAFVLHGPDGQPLPGQLKAPYFLADAPGNIGGDPNIHNVKYSPAADRFVAVFTTTNPSTTYVASLEITSDHRTGGGGDEPSLTVRRTGTEIEITWPSDAGAFRLESTTDLGPNATWTPVPGVTGNTVTITPSGTATFYRLVQ